MWLFSFPNTIYWSDCPFSIVYSWLFLLKINWLFIHEFISRFSSVLHWAMSLFFSPYHTIFINYLCNVLGNQWVWCLLLCTFSRLLCLFGVWHFLMKLLPCLLDPTVLNSLSSGLVMFTLLMLLGPVSSKIRSTSFSSREVQWDPKEVEETSKGQRIQRVHPKKCKSKPLWGTISHQSEWLWSKSLQVSLF